ncbi:hypothetical protein Pcinc_007199 [Petrolisthes cinctipes]|uniref:Uncharacterized protein n=1 Tax=Petrolisthes cinctipes TaxID=88211 RepID=A0AAE1GBI6_PETCI|nr:hypothetical protein Pcinc_007199 [Petrolisthes cinctipes]
MEVYMRINYLSTRVTYSCEDCVKVKTEGYEEIRKLIYSVGNNNSASNDDASVNKPHNDQTGHINQLIMAVTDIGEQLYWITKNKIGDETQQQRDKLYSDIVRENKEQLKTISNNQAVFVKSMEGTNQVDENELVTALKSVPTIVVKKIKNNTVKLILPNEDTKEKALTAFAESNLSDTIEDDDVVNFIKEKNRHILELAEQGHTLKILLKKNGASGFKTVVAATSLLHFTHWYTLHVSLDTRPSSSTTNTPPLLSPSHVLPLDHPLSYETLPLHSPPHVDHSPAPHHALHRATLHTLCCSTLHSMPLRHPQRHQRYATPRLYATHGYGCVSRKTSDSRLKPHTPC